MMTCMVLPTAIAFVAFVRKTNEMVQPSIQLVPYLGSHAGWALVIPSVGRVRVDAPQASHTSDFHYVHLECCWGFGGCGAIE